MVELSPDAPAASLPLEFKLRCNHACDQSMVQSPQKHLARHWRLSSIASSHLVHANLSPSTMTECNPWQCAAQTLARRMVSVLTSAPHERDPQSTKLRSVIFSLSLSFLMPSTANLFVGHLVVTCVDSQAPSSTDRQTRASGLAFFELLSPWHADAAVQRNEEIALCGAFKEISSESHSLFENLAHQSLSQSVVSIVRPKWRNLMTGLVSACPS